MRLARHVGTHPTSQPAIFGQKPGEVGPRRPTWRATWTGVRVDVVRWRRTKCRFSSRAIQIVRYTAYRASNTFGTVSGPCTCNWRRRFLTCLAVLDQPNQRYALTEQARKPFWSQTVQNWICMRAFAVRLWLDGGHQWHRRACQIARDDMQQKPNATNNRSVVEWNWGDDSCDGRRAPNSYVIYIQRCYWTSRDIAALSRTQLTSPPGR